MDVIIKSVDFTAGADLENFITDKLSKLSKLEDNIIRARVTLENGPESVNDCHCGIRLEVPGNDHFVSKAASNFEAAAMEAVDTLLTILRRNK